MKSNYKRLGDYIQEVKARNYELTATSLLGINIDKFFMPSVANIVGTDMSVYKIVKKNQFACNRMHVGRDYRLPVALSKANEDFMVSPAYDVFEIKDEEKLLPEFLMMWFSRSEFDRNAWFYTDADVRGGLNWKAFCDMDLPIPKPGKQKEIVKEYNVLVNRIALNNQLIQKLEETAQAIYKQWFVDFEFPDEERKPYKSNGGEIQASDLGEKPKGWDLGKLSDILSQSVKKISVNDLNLNNYISTENMEQNRGGVFSANNLPSATAVTKFNTGEILISNIRPYFKKIWLANFEGGCSNDVLCFVPKKGISSLFIYYILEKDIFFDYVMAGSKGTKMPRGDKKWIMNYTVVIPDSSILKDFTKKTKTISLMISQLKKENKLLRSMSELLLSKLATIEN